MSNDLSPAVQKAVHSVRKLVRDGALLPGSRLPAETDLAQSLGVSRNTVRRAIEVLTREGDLERRPHARPIVAGTRAAVAANRQDVLVWVCHTIGDDGMLAFLRGLSKALALTHLRVSVREPGARSHWSGTEEERRFLLDALSDPKIAGVVMARDAYSDNRDLLDRLAGGGIPMVFVDGKLPKGLQADFVGTANLLAAQRAIESLVELGHQRIVCLTDDLVPRANEERAHGYRRAMAQAEREALVIVAKDLPAETAPRPAAGPFASRLNRSDYFGILAARLVGAVLAMDPMPTALFVTCDGLAYAVCAYLEGAGIDLPCRISVVGFDGLDRFSAAPCGDLTTCAQDFEGFGAHAASMLLERLEASEPPEARRVLLDAPLVVRSSTTYCLPAADSDPGSETASSDHTATLVRPPV